MMQLWLWLTGLACTLVLLRQVCLKTGNWAAQQDQLQLAASLYALALSCWPGSSQAWSQMGNVLGDLGHWQAADFCFTCALALDHNQIEGHLGRGTASLVLQSDWRKADQHFFQAYVLRRGWPQNLGSKPKLKPSLLFDKPDLISPDLVTHLQAQKQVLKQLGVPLSAETSPVQTQQALYLERPNAKRYPLQALPQQALEAAYHARPGLVWHDGLLQADVLQQLLELCQRSTFWHHAYAQGYLGAYLDDGLTCPLLYQIAEAIKAALPGIFGSTKLLYLWAFKCQHTGQGVALHHDSALINVNFWLTPDSANQNTESGGLCVYLHEPPKTWDLERYSLSSELMRNFLNQTESQKHCVPYRQNRVVIFNSRLLHATQAFDFMPGYSQQRLNITLLFGHQPLRYHPKRPLPQVLWRDIKAH